MFMKQVNIDEKSKCIMDGPFVSCQGTCPLPLEGYDRMRKVLDNNRSGYLCHVSILLFPDLLYQH